MGIGSRAMNFAFDDARNLDKKVMVLWVFADNTASVKFYMKCGFSSDGRTMDHDYGKPIKSMRMRKTL